MQNDENIPNITLWVREQLLENQDLTYRDFHKSLVPGLDSMIGVRIPVLRTIGRTAARTDYWKFVQEADLSVYEECMLRGMLIGYGKLSMEEQKAELRSFVPFITNWAVCDSCCTTYKFMKKNQEEWFAFLLPWAESHREYEVRFAVVCMLDFFVNQEFLERVLAVLENIKGEKITGEAYYVKMAVAWAVSVCYVKFPEITEKFLQKNSLDAFTHNKAIQKIRESYRVSKEEKERLNQWKRKEKKEQEAQQA